MCPGPDYGCIDYNAIIIEDTTDTVDITDTAHVDTDVDDKETSSTDTVDVRLNAILQILISILIKINISNRSKAISIFRVISEIYR